VPASSFTGPAPGADAGVRELMAPRAPLGLPVPAYDGRSVPNVTASIVLALGGEPSDAALAPLASPVDPFGGRRAEGPVLLFVVDGLGYERLRRQASGPRGELARGWFELARPITTVFPTTTTSALTSLSTATSPSRHGIVGYRQFLPRFGSVVDMLRSSPLGVATEDALLGPAWTPQDVVGAPTIFRRGVPAAVAVSRDRFEGRGFTRILYDGAAYEGYVTWSDFAGALVKVLARRPAPPLTVAYWDELDTIEHLRGPASTAADLELDRLVVLLDYVAREVGNGPASATTVLVTADHGLVPADPARQLAVESERDVVEHLARPPTGDRRVGLLRARDGEEVALREALERRLPEGARILPAEAALDAGLFGPRPFHPELRERVGDLVVLVPSPSGLTYRLPGRLSASRHLVGAHGGLEADELVVPLVAGPLERFRRGSNGL